MRISKMIVHLFSILIFFMVGTCHASPDKTCVSNNSATEDSHSEGAAQAAMRMSSVLIKTMCH